MLHSVSMGLSETFAMVASMASKREYFEEMFEKLSGTLLDLTT